MLLTASLKCGGMGPVWLSPVCGRDSCSALSNSPWVVNRSGWGNGWGNGCCFPPAARYAFAQPQLAGTGMAVGLLRVLDKGKAIDPLSMYLDIVYFAYLFQVV